MTIATKRRRLHDLRLEHLILTSYQDTAIEPMYKAVARYEAAAAYHYALAATYTDRRAIRAQRRAEHEENKADDLRARIAAKESEQADIARRRQHLGDTIAELQAELQADLHNTPDPRAGKPSPDAKHLKLDALRQHMLARYTIGQSGHLLSKHGSPIKSTHVQVHGTRVSVSRVRDILLGRL